MKTMHSEFTLLRMHFPLVPASWHPPRMRAGSPCYVRERRACRPSLFTSSI